MSKSYYLRCKPLHAIAKVCIKTQKLQYVDMLLIIPVVIDMHGHRFEVFTLVSESHENVDLVLGIKNIFELEGIIDSQESCFNFSTEVNTFLSKEQIVLKPKEHRFIKIEAPFVYEISGLVILKVLDTKEQSAVTLKLKYIWNTATLDVTNNTLHTVIFDSKEMLGILDLRSMGYFRVKHATYERKEEKDMVQTSSQAKSSGITLPEVYV